MQKATEMKSLLILLSFATAATAQTKIFVPLSDSEGLLITSPSTVLVERVAIQQIVYPVKPGPIIEPPDGTLAAVVATARGTVQEYGDKGKDCQKIAFTLNFLAQAVKGDGSADAARKMVRQATDSAIGDNAAAWFEFWIAIDAKTAGMTATQYSQAMKTIAAALCADMAAADTDDTFYGSPTFGLDNDFLKELFKILLPILLQMLKGLF